MIVLYIYASNTLTHLQQGHLNMVRQVVALHPLARNIELYLLPKNAVGTAIARGDNFTVSKNNH